MMKSLTDPVATQAQIASPGAPKASLQIVDVSAVRPMPFDFLPCLFLLSSDSFETADGPEWLSALSEAMMRADHEKRVTRHDRPAAYGQNSIFSLKSPVPPGLEARVPRQRSDKNSYCSQLPPPHRRSSRLNHLPIRGWHVELLSQTCIGYLGGTDQVEIMLLVVG